MKTVIDNFSAASADYAHFRPQSPREIFDFLFHHTPGFGKAWDCGTGNGQVASQLATRFEHVYGTDISAAQLKHAVQLPNVTYREERAEQTSLADNSIDLITVAQAIHWFDFDNFYTEVRRVAKPGALLAAWTYTTLQLTPAVNDVISCLYTDITGPYWDKERKWVDAGYSTIPFPFRELEAPPVQIVKHITIAELAGYLGTWSGTKHYIAREHKDPVDMILDDLKKAWGSAETIEATWPIKVRAGFID